MRNKLKSWIAFWAMLTASMVAFAAPVGPVLYSAILSNQMCVAWDSTTTVTAQTIDVPNPYSSGTISKMWMKTGGSGSPTFNASLQIAGTNVTGCTTIAATTSQASTNCTAANTTNAGDILSFVIASPSGTPNQAYVCAEISHPVE